jgi:hypothetical protein
VDNVLGKGKQPLRSRQFGLDREASCSAAEGMDKVEWSAD